MLCNRSIHTRVLFKDSRITKNEFREFGPDATLRVSLWAKRDAFILELPKLKFSLTVLI